MVDTTSVTLEVNMKIIGKLGNNKNVEAILLKGRGNMPGLAKHLAHQIGGDPHFFTRCMTHESVAGYDEDARAGICAKAHKLVVGKWPAEGGHEKKQIKWRFVAKKGGSGSGDFGHSGRPGQVGGSSGGHGGGGVPSDTESGKTDIGKGGMSDKEVIRSARRSLKNMAANVHQWSVRDSLMTIANDFLGKDYVALGGESGKATAHHLAQQLSHLPNEQMLELYEKYYNSLGMWDTED